MTMIISQGELSKSVAHLIIFKVKVKRTKIVTQTQMVQILSFQSNHKMTHPRS
jgi:hypothetical protein